MRFRLALFVAGASGFVALSYEILWYRLCAFVTQGGSFAFGALLGFYLIGIAIGSYRSRVYCETHDGTSPEGAEAADSTLRALGLFLFLANLVAFLVAPALEWIVTVAPWYPALLVVMVATALLGAVLPLVSHLAIAADDRAGARLSYLYIANIIGSSTGSLLTGFVAMDLWSTRQIAVGLALLGFLLAAVILFAAERRGPRARGEGVRAWGAHAWTSIAALALAAGLVVVCSHPIFDQLYERLLYRQDFPSAKHFTETVENRSGLIHVSSDGRIWGGGVYDGAFNVSLESDKNWIVRAFAVSAMHPRPKRMLMVGLASGSWGKVLAAAPGLEHLTVIEINPGYLEIIARHPEVAGLLGDPKVEIVIDDGRRWLLAHPDERFDAVVMNTTWHWRAHTTNLLSREFAELVKKHLTAGGLFFFNTTWSVDACKTALDVFPHTFRVINFVAGSEAPIQIDSGAWKALLEEYRIDGRPVLDLTSDAGRQAEARLLAFIGPGMGQGGVEADASLRQNCAAGEVVTDDNMLPEWRQILHWEKP